MRQVCGSRVTSALQRPDDTDHWAAHLPARLKAENVAATADHTSSRLGASSALTCRAYHGRPFKQQWRAMPAKRSNVPTPTSPAEWKRLEAAAAAELARRTEQAYLQILEVLRTHGQKLSQAQRRSLHRRLRRGRS